MSERRSAGTAVLQVSGLNVYYGASHALQGVDLVLNGGVLSVVGRNGMGKTTLCKAIMGLVPVSSGSIRFNGQEISNRTPAQVARLGVGYVPQGRRLWRSLSVDEHLRMVGGKGAWTAERIYATFPRLAERKNNGGAQLSGGEQQMLAIARALLLNPQLLIMDEPTEGLAPVIVNQVQEMLIRLAEEGEMDVLVIEQNIGVATAVAEQVAIMVNGQVNRLVDAGSLASDRALQQRLLGVGRHGEDAAEAERIEDAPAVAGSTADSIIGAGGTANGKRAGASLVVYLSNPQIPNRWSKPVSPRVIEQSARTRTDTGIAGGASVVALQAALTVPSRPMVIVAGAFDTKGRELYFIRDILKARQIPVQTVDLSTSSHHSGADVPAHQVAAFHPRGSSGVFTNDRGTAVAGMTLAFQRWVAALSGPAASPAGSASSKAPGGTLGDARGAARTPVLGMIGAGGSGAAALVTPAMRALPFGVPKVLVSTVASGDVRRYVGPADILMLHSVADVQGLNSITREVLANGAHALAGMVEGRARSPVSSASASGAATDLPAVGITMFGVTTPCVQQLCAALDERYDCLVFHATGIGGESMESLVDERQIRAVIDITTTEVCDLLSGGVFPCTDDRFGAIARTRIPYVGSCGALDMVNFAAPDSVPERFRGRTFYEHNPQITLMRTTAEENRAMGQWIGERLNRMDGPVRFFLPEGGVSALDAPGQAFHDPAANRALFDSLTATVRQTSQRQLIRSPHHVNAPEFVTDVLAAFRALHGGLDRPVRRRQRQTS